MKINKSHPLRGLLLATMLIPVFSCAAMLHAQSTNAVVTGFVTDASGAKLPGATVSYRNVDTGVSSTTTTNAEGLYLVPNLLPGTYQATIKMLGFKEAVNQGLNLQVEDQVALNYSLSIGETSETVTVTADENVLETSSPTVSQVIEGRQVEETPLNGRNAMNLVALTPGVVPQGGTQLNHPISHGEAQRRMRTASATTRSQVGSLPSRASILTARRSMASSIMP